MRQVSSGSSPSYGADADHDGVSSQFARFVHMTAGGLAGNPAAVTGVRGDFAVQRHRVLERHKRQFCA